MATTLAEQNTRANDPAFRNAVAAALWRLIPDVIGEAVNASINDGNTPVSLSQPMIDKRHAWAVDFTRQPDFWIPKVSAMLAGEPSIILVDVPTIPPDATITARVSRLVHALSGVKATEP
jgi:hypothetical protein